MSKNELIGGIFYINLDHRTDRKAEIEAEFERMDLQGAKRIPGIPTDPGYLGCGLAHEAAVKAGKGLKNVLIFEDDFQFLVSPDEFWSQLEDAMKEPYDCIMLGCNLRESEPYEDRTRKRVRSTSELCSREDSSNLVRVKWGCTGSGYLINGHMIDTIATLFEDSNKQLASTHKHWLYCNDQCWRPLQEQGLWLTFKDRIGKQRPSYSDNNKMFANHNV